MNARNRQRARWAVKYALQIGRLVRGPCEAAGADCSGPIEAHHDDYAKPLVVRWFCRRHHRQLDGPKMARRGQSNSSMQRMYARLRAAECATNVQPGTSENENGPQKGAATVNPGA